MGCLVLCLAGAVVAKVPEGPDPQDVQLLQQHQIRPDGPGLLGYLRSLHRGEVQNQLVLALIVQLGSKTYRERVTANQKLASLGRVALPQLRQALDHPPNEEVRRRAESLIQKIEEDGEAVLMAVLRVVQVEPPEGVVAELLSLSENFEEPSIKFALRETLLEASRPRDAEALRRGLRAGQTEVRLAALTALDKVLGAAAVPDALRVQTDPDADVRLGAVHVLLRHVPREALEPLLGLLDSNAPRVRTEANRLLRAMTGQDFEFVGYDPPALRQRAAERWRAWVAEHGKTATLRPLSD